MSKADNQNSKRPNDQGSAPTHSFDSSVIRPGSQIGPFRIERELGHGAMGVVYLAHDTKLDRPVAIKSLPAEVMDNQARSRFSREARLLASLNHPNIATIYEELEEAEGVSYLVLEYVPGRINYRSYDVTREGKFLMIQEPQEPTRLGINIVLNWFEELKQIAPAETD
ncbi:MAG: protein kinase [Phycisphaerae bacterium]|nr:protein kinase [Phycisphaerae bacterium]